MEITSSYFHCAAIVMKARSKFRKYKEVIAASKEFVQFVIETQGRWGFHAREIFKSVYAKIPLRESRISRKFWQQKISLAYMRAAISNIHQYYP